VHIFEFNIVRLFFLIRDYNILFSQGKCKQNKRTIQIISETANFEKSYKHLKVTQLRSEPNQSSASFVIYPLSNSEVKSNKQTNNQTIKKAKIKLIVPAGKSNMRSTARWLRVDILRTADSSASMATIAYVSDRNKDDNEMRKKTNKQKTKQNKTRKEKEEKKPTKHQRHTLAAACCLRPSAPVLDTLRDRFCGC
jgi:hypothetical protein